jgi:hypothetical protein
MRRLAVRILSLDRPPEERLATIGTKPRDERPFRWEVATLGISGCTRAQPRTTARLAKKQRYDAFSKIRDFYSRDASSRLLAVRRRPSVRFRAGRIGPLRRIARQRHSSHPGRLHRKPVDARRPSATSLLVLTLHDRQPPGPSGAAVALTWTVCCMPGSSPKVHPAHIPRSRPSSPDSLVCQLAEVRSTRTGLPAGRCNRYCA